MNSAEIDLRILLSEAIASAIKAGQEILAIYQLDFAVEHKEDKSPLTLADRNSHDIITAGLRITGLPILSEEGKDIPYEERQNWEYFWLVDPLDGTKEFIKRNGEFTVNIALIHKSRPVLSVIYVPVTDVLYFAVKRLGSYKLANAGEVSVRQSVIQACPESFFDAVMSIATKLPLPRQTNRPYTVVASRSHMSRETEEYLDKLRADHGEIEVISAGSSLKFCLVAEGLADEYPRFGPTMEWDTGAGQAIVEEAGGVVINSETRNALDYNKKKLLNPYFAVICRCRE